MRKGTLDRIKKVYDMFGYTVSRSDITTAEDSGKLPKGSCTAVVNYADTVTRGVYDLTRVLSEFGSESSENEVADESVKAEPTFSTENTEVHAVASALSAEDRKIAIPSVDPFYVKDSFGCYGILETVLSKDAFCPVFITGLSGNGKTMAVEQACAQTKRPLVIFNVTNETTEEDLIGHYTLVDDNLVWRDGPVLQAYREGAVLCLDEVDQGTSRLMCLQTILQMKPYYIKKTNETVSPAKGFNVIATGNTKGKGDDSDVFVGAQIMNEAFLERFPITVHQSYPTPAVEKRILNKIILNNSELTERLVSWAQQSRKSSENSGLDGFITTRRLVQIANLIPIFGTVEKAIDLATNRFGEDTKDALIKLYQVTK